MKIIKKGSYGYIKQHRIIEIAKTAAMLIISFSLYNIGISTTGSNKNLLTLVAVLGCLPMAKFAVNSIMFSKAKGCSLTLKEKLATEQLDPMFYDLYFTAFKNNYQVSALYYKRKNLILITEDEKTNIEEGEKHLKNILSNCGYDNITIKYYKNADKYIERMRELKTLDEADSDITVLKDNLLSVSI